MKNLINRNITSLNGIGERRAKLFNKLDIYSVADLLKFYPRSYEDWRDVVPVLHTTLNEISVIKGTVVRPARESRIAGGKILHKLEVDDGENIMHITFFNNMYIPYMLKSGTEYYFRGKVTGSFTRREMVSPEFSLVAKELIPIYPQTSGLSTKHISSAVKEALKLLPQNLDDCIPDEIRKKYQLCHSNYAIENIHFPMTGESAEIARKRLIFEELLILQIAMRKIKAKNKNYTSHILSKNYLKEFQSLLPFNLTNAQLKSVNDCISDMQKNTPMNRLLQGDVGSGKTAVAAALCHTCIKNNIQCAMMAPTEILAVQHYNSLKELLEPCGIAVNLLTGSLTAKEKREVYKELEQGDIQLLIGTHALISEKVSFKNLGLVITDEQHRFGVKQRSALALKGQSPHMLVMSATPIPRTLALMIYGDLDISVLDELPSGRQKIETYGIRTDKRLRAFTYIQKHLDEGRQAYIVCPLIEEGVNELANIGEYFDFLKNHFDEKSIGILHGKMKAKEKEAVMDSFSKGEIKLLLATTVVEVGVDVPNAVVMLIENAEMYGLSQLHQLRGRVGRGKHKSTCILVSDAQNPETIERLKLMCSTTDGFKIADADLSMRGPGDFFGKKQHGLPKLKIADMAKDMEVLKLASQCASEILEDDPDLKGNSSLLGEISYLFKSSGNEDNMIL